MTAARKPYPSDVTDAEWAFPTPDLNLMREDAPQREIPLRLLFNAIRCVVKTRRQWRYLPHEFPPWTAGTSRRGGGWRPAFSRASFTICG